MIVDYQTLQDAVAAWLARADLTSQIPTFIQLAETRMNRDLRVRGMQATLSGSVNTDNTIRLPADCRAVQSLSVLVGSRQVNMHPLPPERLKDNITSGVPVGYVTIGNIAQLIGGSGTPTYILRYYQSIPPLATAPLNVNWLLVREPAIYLYATLLEASPYIRDMETAQAWAAQYKNILEGIEAEDVGERYGNSPSIPAPMRNAP